MASRKDYEAIAQIIRESSNLTDLDRLDKANVIQRLSLYFEEDNPNFDSERFWNACHPGTRPDIPDIPLRGHKRSPW